MRNSGIALSNLSPKYQAQVFAQLGSAEKETASEPAPSKARLKQSKRKISLLEQRWGMELRAKNPLARVYDQFPLAIGNNCNYYVDYVVVDEKDGWSRIRAHEVKGPYSRAAGIIKLKAAARIYPWIKFSLVSEIKGRGWVTEVVLP